MQLGGKIARHVAGLRWDDTLDEIGTPLVDCRQHQEVRRQRREECRQERVSVADSLFSLGKRLSYWSVSDSDSAQKFPVKFESG